MPVKKFAILQEHLPRCGKVRGLNFPFEGNRNRFLKLRRSFYRARLQGIFQGVFFLNQFCQSCGTSLGVFCRLLSFRRRFQDESSRSRKFGFKYQPDVIGRFQIRTSPKNLGRIVPSFPLTKTGKRFSNSD